ncbi:2-amino-4-hydroxy-6-hydroxymethyldihydropteridine diphosphokinase [bacterium]|nr:2-amino-4-hydroxy-6-hydroxymethyldihydropteridine diphosphokinase [bacterium]
MRTKEKAYICLGSNLGDREENLKKAVELVGKVSLIRVSKASSLYETEPVGKKDQGCFLNQVIEVETALTPLELLGYLQEVEAKLGRERKDLSSTSIGERWGPRTVDLDILLYGDIQIDQADLRIPHPEMHRRAFVLIPLAEIAPEARHPELNKSIEELLLESPDESEVRRWIGPGYP